MASNQAVTESVAILCEAFSRTASKTTFLAYREALRDLTDEELKTAVHRALRESRFMPPPAELRSLVLLSHEERAVRAWIAFERAVMRHGYIHSVNFDDPLINAVVRALGGWEHCCGMPADEFDTFLQKRFQETYRALAARGIGAEECEPLCGYFERQNRMNGHAIAPTRQIATGLPQARVVAGRISG